MAIETPDQPGELRCPNCGAAYAGGTRFCGTCGSILPGAEALEGAPVTFDIEYPERLSRLLIFVKWLLVIPHFIILILLGIAQWVVLSVAFYSILFTKRYPKGLFDFVAGVNRWSLNAGAYFALLRDEYPPFSWESGIYPVRFEVAYPLSLNRWLPFVKTGNIIPLSYVIIFPFPLLLIPHIIVLIFLMLAAILVTLVAWFAILFTGRYPRGLFDFIVGVFRWGTRVNVYYYLLRDEYPPFSMK